MPTKPRWNDCQVHVVCWRICCNVDAVLGADVAVHCTQHCEERCSCTCWRCFTTNCSILCQALCYSWHAVTTRSLLMLSCLLQSCHSCHRSSYMLHKCLLLSTVSVPGIVHIARNSACVGLSVKVSGARMYLLLEKYVMCWSSADMLCGCLPRAV